MKKNIYALLWAMLALTTATSCSEDEGTEPGNDSQPVITVYEYTAKSPLNADNDVCFRVAANSKVQEAYYLIELTSAKEARGLDSDAYADYVIANGTKLAEITGSSDQYITQTELEGMYTITVVGVNGKNKSIRDFEFAGLKFVPYAKGLYYSDFFYEEWEAILEYSEIGSRYRFVDCWVEGYNAAFTLNGSTVTMVPNSSFETGYVHPTYGMVSVTPGSCTYDESTQTFTFDYKWTVAAGSFGSYPDSFTITEKL